jgi:hypothetical protein
MWPHVHPPLQVVFQALSPTLSTILHSLTMLIARGEEPLHFVRPQKLLTIYHNSKYKIGKRKRKKSIQKEHPRASRWYANE